MMRVKKAIDFIIKKLSKELPSTLTYHSVSHTVGVIDASIAIGNSENISEHEHSLLTIAAAYHDSGFLLGYENHEENSCVLLEENASRFDIGSDDLAIIKKMIMTTKIPQSPNTLLEKILCDADLDYLGGKRYEEISSQLFRELKLNGKELSQEAWLDMQISFLSSHQYWTEFSKKKRDAGKARVLNNLKSLVSANGA